MTVRTEGPTPVSASTSRNLVRDGRFLHVDQVKRDAAAVPEAAVQLFSQKGRPPIYHWSDIWDVDGDTPQAQAAHDIEILGKGWFVDAAKNRALTGYSIGWPPVESGDPGYSINTNGWGYGELGQDVEFDAAGTVNLNFLSVRDNIHNCGDRGDSFEVELRPLTATGAESMLAKFSDAAHGDWVRQSHDFEIKVPGKYRLIMKGVANDPIHPMCGSFIADIVLAYRHKPKPIALSVPPLKQNGNELILETTANGYFPSFHFILVDGDGELEHLLPHFPVIFEIAQPAASGIHFEKQPDAHLYTTESARDATVVMPATTLRAGSPPAGPASDELLIKADGTVIAKIKLVVKKATHPSLDGDAAAVIQPRATYISGDAQSAASKSRFRHALMVDVRDAKGAPAVRGQVTFKVLPTDDGSAGYLSESGDRTWQDVSGENHTKLDVRVSDGHARVWLWGQNSAAAHPGHVKVEAYVNGKADQIVTFHENVWPSGKALTLGKEQGDRQTVYQGEKPEVLRVRAVREDEPSHGADHEWLHWIIDSSSPMQFPQVQPTQTIEWENAKSVWTRTDVEGHASAPLIEVTAGSMGTGKVSVESPVAEAAVFTLTLKLKEQKHSYRLERMGDETAVRINFETDFSIKVLDSDGKGVPNVQVRAAIFPPTNTANANVTPAAPTSARTNEQGVAEFEVLAHQNGAFVLQFNTDNAQSISINLTATAQMSTSRLEVTLGKRLTLVPMHATADHPISIHLSPPDEGVPLLHFAVAPKKNDGLFVWQNDAWVHDGNLHFHDGVAHIGKLQIEAASPPNPATFTIRFSVPGHESTLYDEAIITVGGQAYVHLHPDTSTDANRRTVDSDSEIGNDPFYYVQVYTDAARTIPATDVQVRFVIDIQATNQPEEAVAFTEGPKAEHVGTSNANGKSLLPAIKIERGFTGDFQVSVYAGTSREPDGVFFFRAQTPLAAQFIKFDPDETQKKLHPTTYDEDHAAGRVLVYTDSQQTVPAHSGSVNFSIDASSTAIAKFAGKTGAYDQLQAPSPINSRGWAKIPPLRVSQEGTLVIIATINTLPSVSYTFQVIDE